MPKIFSDAITESSVQDMILWSGVNNRCAFWECCNEGDSMDSEDAQANLRAYLKERGTWMDQNIDKVRMGPYLG